MKIIIHGGFFSESSQSAETKLAKQQALSQIAEASYDYLKTHTALQTIVYAVELLENDELFNAGIGSQIELIKYVDTINKSELMITKLKACLACIVPAGISLTAVLGFNLSKCLSMYRLNAMAALRANTIHNTTKTNNLSSNGLFVLRAKAKPIMAKGKAKIV